MEQEMVQEGYDLFNKLDDEIALFVFRNRGVEGKEDIIFSVLIFLTVSLYLNLMSSIEIDKFCEKLTANIKDAINSRKS